MFMESVGQPPSRITPTLGLKTIVAKAARATFKPNLLTTAGARRPVVPAWQCPCTAGDPKLALPLLGHPACWRKSTNGLQLC